jgi:hypothetical protein
MRLIDGDRSWWGWFNRLPFMIGHSLHNNPLFRLTELAKIAEMAVERGDEFEVNISAGKEWESLPPKRRLAKAVEEIENGHATGNRWIKISHLGQLRPEYQVLTDGLIEEFESLSGERIRPKITFMSTSLFITSPNYFTPYHFDHDHNFLFQIRGEKDVVLFDQNDRSVLTETEIEQFYQGDVLAGVWRDEIAGKGRTYPLKPGLAVHHPPLAPHMVQNRDNVSISVSIYYSSTDIDRRMRVYQANGLLRRLGLSPKPPGAATDPLKAAALSAVSKSKAGKWTDHMFSGVNRMNAPLQAARWVARKIGIR